jgi:hypothetical protein
MAKPIYVDFVCSAKTKFSRLGRVGDNVQWRSWRLPRGPSRIPSRVGAGRGALRVCMYPDRYGTKCRRNLRFWTSVLWGRWFCAFSAFGAGSGSPVIRSRGWKLGRFHGPRLDGSGDAAQTATGYDWAGVSRTPPSSYPPCQTTADGAPGGPGR